MYALLVKAAICVLLIKKPFVEDACKNKLIYRQTFIHVGQQQTLCCPVNKQAMAASGTQDKTAKTTKMPTLQEMQELYEKITPLQKIVTLQHIYSLYMAASQNAEKKEVSFNIIQLQRMINSNPLVNPDFDFLNITEFLSGTKDTGNSSSSSSNNNNSNSNSHNSNSSKGPVSPVQLIQILTESLTLRDERGQNEQVIQQVPNSMLFKLSKYIDLNFVKDRLIKLLNSYKNDTLTEIEELEKEWKAKSTEIADIEGGEMNDGVLYEEFLKELKRKRGSGGNAKKSSEDSSVEVSPSAATVSTTAAGDGDSVDTPQGKKLQISRNVSKTVEKTIENSSILSGQKRKRGDVDDSEEDGDGNAVSDTESSVVDTEQKLQVKRRTRTRSQATSVSIDEDVVSAKKHDSKRFQQLSVPLITQISSHRIASMFTTPVDEPDYDRVVKQATDLKSITRQIKAGEVKSVDELELRMQVMFTNAVVYNCDVEGMQEGILDMMHEWDKLVSMLRESL